MVCAPAGPARPADSSAVAAIDVKNLVCFAIIHLLPLHAETRCSFQATVPVTRFFFDTLTTTVRLKLFYFWYVSIMCLSGKTSFFQHSATYTAGTPREVSLHFACISFRYPTSHG